MSYTVSGPSAIASEENIGLSRRKWPWHAMWAVVARSSRASDAATDASSPARASAERYAAATSANSVDAADRSGPVISPTEAPGSDRAGGGDHRVALVATEIGRLIRLGRPPHGMLWSTPVGTMTIAARGKPQRAAPTVRRARRGSRAARPATLPRDASEPPARARRVRAKRDPSSSGGDRRANVPRRRNVHRRGRDDDRRQCAIDLDVLDELAIVAETRHQRVRPRIAGDRLRPPRVGPREVAHRRFHPRAPRVPAGGRRRAPVGPRRVRLAAGAVLAARRSAVSRPVDEPVRSRARWLGPVRPTRARRVADPTRVRCSRPSVASFRACVVAPTRRSVAPSVAW